MVVTKDTLSREVGDILQLSIPRSHRQGKAYDIVKAIFKAMSQALQRGEEIRIDGFGIFKVRRRAATRRGAYFYPYLDRKGLHTEVLDVPAKNIVEFKPSKPLQRMVNDN